MKTMNQLKEAWPRVPYEAMEYEAALIPLLSHVARIATDQKTKDNGNSKPADDTIVVLISLDESHNGILSFGRIGPDVSWYKEDRDPSISAGFLNSQGFQDGNSSPSVNSYLASNRHREMSSYAVNWNLDPATLAKVIDRRNANIQSTAKLPGILKVAIFYDVKTLPFQQNNFAVPYAFNLWKDNETTRQNIPLGRELKNAIFTIEVNEVRQVKYRLKRIFRLELFDEYSDEIETSCTMLEFEAN